MSSLHVTNARIWTGDHARPYASSMTIRAGLVESLDVAPGDEPVLDCGGDFITPGFIDAHVHLPQYRVRGRFRDALLPWLREHIWPEEERFAERSYREAVTTEFRLGLLAAGTTSAMVYGSPEADSVHAVLRDLAPLCIRGGDVLMDRNGPPALLLLKVISNMHVKSPNEMSFY